MIKHDMQQRQSRAIVQYFETPMRLKIFVSISFLITLSQVKLVSHAQEATTCHDFLSALNKKPKALIFQGCKSRADLQDSPLEATYRVEGIHGADVESCLKKELNMKELKHNCCLWESPENSFRDKSGHLLMISMASEETVVSSRNDWAKIPYFYVVVQFYSKEP